MYMDVVKFLANKSLVHVASSGDVQGVRRVLGEGSFHIDDKDAVKYYFHTTFFLSMNILYSLRLHKYNNEG